MGNKPSVYLWKGHARDICDYLGNPLLEDVPPGSIVVQTGQCGLKNITDLVGVQRIVSQNERIFFDPVKNKQRIEELLAASGIPLISIHTAGDPHKIVTSVAKLIDIQKGSNKSYIMESAGVQRIEGTSDDNSAVLMYNFGEGELSITLFATIYRQSVFPTEEGVKTYLTQKFDKPTMSEDELNSLSDDTFFVAPFTGIIKKFPGIHYHLLCRGVATEKCKKTAQLRREQSRTRLQTEKPSLEHLALLYKRYRQFPEIAMDEDFNHLTNKEFKFIFRKLVEDETARSCEPPDSRLTSITDPKMGLIQIVTKMMGQSANPEELKPEFIEAWRICVPAMSEKGANAHWNILMSQIESRTKFKWFEGRGRTRRRRRRRSRRAKSYNS